jgi:hypothetical protein
MYTQLLDGVLDRLGKRVATADEVTNAKRSMTPPPPKRVTDRTFAYSQRHRGQWFRPEYDFDEIQIAQDTDSYMFRAIQKKVNRVIVAGMSFVGANEETVEYIRQRMQFQSIATGKPYEQLVWDTFHDLFRFSNCMWVKKRDRLRSMGKVRTDIAGAELDPVAGYFILPFETLEFKTKANGEYKKVMQKMPDGRRKEFAPKDVVHFYTNKKPGFTVGTPELFPALDDIALLRRIEENVEDLIEANLFPVFHYKVGNDAFPERYGPDGTKESDVVKQTIEYMPAGGIYVSDHRHEIEAVGSEGRALRIDFYVNHFKNRALAALGTSAVDMGEGGSANRSTASTMSKGMLMDVEAMTVVVKQFIEFFVITELLLEGGFNPLDPEQMVFVKFGIIDKEERRADENQQIQLFHGNLRTMQEVRSSLGDRPYTDEDYEDSHFKRFEEPLALVKGMGPGSAAGQTLAEHPASNVSPEAVKKEEAFTEKQAKEAAKAKAATAAKGRPSSSSKSKSASSSSANKSRPKNQHGTRSSAKTNRDIMVADSAGAEHIITCDFDVDPATIPAWRDEVLTRWEQLSDDTISFDTLARTMVWRLRGQ